MFSPHLENEPCPHLRTDSWAVGILNITLVTMVTTNIITTVCVDMGLPLYQTSKPIAVRDLIPTVTPERKAEESGLEPGERLRSHRAALEGDLSCKVGAKNSNFKTLVYLRASQLFLPGPPWEKKMFRTPLNPPPPTHTHPRGDTMLVYYL